LIRLYAQNPNNTKRAILKLKYYGALLN